MSITSEIGDSINGIIKLVDAFHETKSVSLPEYTKKAIVASRAYIDANVADDPILGDVFKVLQNVYVGYILTALQMNQYVANNRTVREMLSTIATESWEEDYIGIESIGTDFAATFQAKGSVPNKPTMIENKDKVAFPSGRIIAIDFNNPSDPKQRFTANIFVQLLPRILPSEVMEQITQLNITTSLYKRWLQYKVGEINFWSDFVFQMDILKKRRDAIKKDRTGELGEVLRRQGNALSKRLLKLVRAVTFTDIFYSGDKAAIEKLPNSQNIANSILVYDKSSFKRYLHSGGLNFKKHNDRQKFFAKAYAMVIVLIDPVYNTVTMYFNGIDAECEYTYNQMADSAKRDTMNIVTMMKQLSQGQSPRF